MHYLQVLLRVYIEMATIHQEVVKLIFNSRVLGLICVQHVSPDLLQERISSALRFSLAVIFGKVKNSWIILNW